MQETSAPYPRLSLVAPDKHPAASQILDAMIHERYQRMFLQGSTGKGKTFTMKAVIPALQSRGNTCSMGDITRIAAVQYLGGTPSICRSGLELADSLQGVADPILATILLSWVHPCGWFDPHRRGLDTGPSGGKSILYDFLVDFCSWSNWIQWKHNFFRRESPRPCSVTTNFSISALPRLITHLSYRLSNQKFQVQQTIGAQNLVRPDNLLSIAKGETDHM
jgi:hypothetical protein